MILTGAVAYLNRVVRKQVAVALDAYDLARRLFPEVLPITGEVMDRARLILGADSTLTARAAVHAAVVAVYKLEGICSFDRDFDRINVCPRMVL